MSLKPPHKVPELGLELSSRELAILGGLNLTHNLYALKTQVKVFDKLAKIHKDGANDTVIDQWTAEEYQEKSKYYKKHLKQSKSSQALSSLPSSTRLPILDTSRPDDTKQEEKSALASNSSRVSNDTSSSGDDDEDDVLDAYFEEQEPAGWLASTRKELKKTRNYYWFSGWFTSIRLVFARGNKILDKYGRAIPNNISIAGSPFKFTALGGLSYGLELLFDLGVIFKHLFRPDPHEKNLAWYTRLWNTLQKDDRWYRMINAVFWFSVNLALLIVTGGGSALANVLPFAFDVLHDRFRESKDVREHEAFLAKVKTQLDEVTNSIKKVISNDGDRFIQLINEQQILENKLSPIDIRLDTYDALYDEKQYVEEKLSDVESKPDARAKYQLRLQKIISSLEKEQPETISRLRQEKQNYETQLNNHKNQINGYMNNNDELPKLIEKYKALKLTVTETTNRIDTVQKARRYGVNTGIMILSGMVLLFFPHLLLFVAAAGLATAGVQAKKLSKTQITLTVLAVAAGIAAFIFPPATFAISAVSFAGIVLIFFGGSIIGGFGRRIANTAFGNAVKNMFVSIGQFFKKLFCCQSQQLDKSIKQHHTSTDSPRSRTRSTYTELQRLLPQKSTSQENNVETSSLVITILDANDTTKIINTTEFATQPISIKTEDQTNDLHKHHSHSHKSLSFLLGTPQLIKDADEAEKNIKTEEVSNSLGQR